MSNNVDINNVPAEFVFISTFIIWTITFHDEEFALLYGGNAVIIVLYLLFYFLYRKPKLEKEKRIQQSKEKIRADYLAQRKLELQEIENKLSELRKQIGGAEIEIKYSDEGFFIVNEKEEKVILNMKVFGFKEIINFEVKDNSKVITNTFTEPATATTSTNTGSMLGRTVVGGVLTGGVGAVIGGATASKTTKIEAGKTTTTSSTKHNYQIIVTVDCMTEPTERLLLGDEAKAAEQIASILSLIINRNKESIESSGTSTISISEELLKLAELREKGILTDEEFQIQKQKILNRK